MSLSTLSEAEQPMLWMVPHGGIQYPGEVIVTSKWRSHLLAPLRGDVYFRVVVLREHQPLPTSPLEDPRIALLVPAPGIEQTRETTQRELHTLRETQAAYLARGDPGIASLRHSLDERVQELEQILLQGEAAAYAAGAVLAGAGVDIDTSTVFVQEQSDLWITEVATQLLRNAYPRLPLDPTHFPHPLHPQDCPHLWNALFSPQPGAEDLSLLAAFAPGLGLAKQEEPHAFNPQGCQVFSLISEEMERQMGTAPERGVLELLAHTHGLTYPLATLYLLAFLRAGAPQAEVLLREEHRLSLPSGEPLPGLRLAGHLVVELAWPENLEEAVVTLRHAEAPSWNTLLPFARVFDPGLQEAQEPREETRQEQRLMEALRAIREETPQLRHTLHTLAQDLDTPLDSEAESSLERLATLVQVQDALQFLQAVQERYVTSYHLGQDVALLQRLKEMASAAPDILHTRRYLLDLRLAGAFPELELNHTSLLQQIELSSFIRDPGRWHDLRSFFHQFRSQYATEYTQHHEKYRREALDLTHDLDQALPKATALDRLNTIRELGGAAGLEVTQQLQQVWRQVKLCPVSPEDLPLNLSPLCSTCNILLGQRPPQQEIRQVLRELDASLEQQNRRLSKRVIHKLLARRRQPHVERFLKVVQASDLSGLANVLDDDLMQFIRELLRNP